MCRFERDDFSSNSHPALTFCLSMISAQTLCVCREGKPVSTFPDHALPEPRGGAAVGFAAASLRWRDLRFHERQNFRWRGVGRAGIERRRRIVFEPKLDNLRGLSIDQE